MTNVVYILEVEEKCFKDKLYQATNCFSPVCRTGLVLPPLSSTLVRTRLLLKVLEKQGILSELLHGHGPMANADECCRVWKQVHTTCIEKNEFQLVSSSICVSANIVSNCIS